MFLCFLNGEIAGTRFEYPSQTPKLTLGRSAENLLVITGEGVSRHHAVLIQKGSTYLIEDLNSTNGVLVNGHRITAPKELAHHDIIGIGDVRIQVDNRTDCTQIFKRIKLSADFRSPTRPLDRTALFDTDMRFSSGVMFNDYVLDFCLGRGGMGEIWCAQNRATKQPVAIKLLYPKYNSNMGMVELFKREIRIAKMLSHPNAAKVLDDGFDKSLNYLVLEYINGSTWQQHLAAHSSLSVQELLQIAWDVSDFLNTAWQQIQFVHCDIKPENIMRTKDDAKSILIDYGVACCHCMMPLQPRGTPAYMSPEQIQAHPLDCRADIYAFGMTLFALWTQRLPYPSMDVHEIESIILSDAPHPAIDTFKEGLPPRFSTLIMKMLNKNILERPQTWQEVLNELQRIADES